MDPVQLRIILPNDALARQVEQRLADYGRTEREPASSMDLGTIAILATIGVSLASIAATRAQTEATRAQIDLTRAQVEATHAQAEATRLAALKTMLEIKQQLQQQGQAGKARIGAPGGELRTFADADEAFLRQLLGVGVGG
jgi:hypothetical protein